MSCERVPPKKLLRASLDLLDCLHSLALLAFKQLALPPRARLRVNSTHTSFGLMSYDVEYKLGCAVDVFIVASHLSRSFNIRTNTKAFPQPTQLDSSVFQFFCAFVSFHRAEGLDGGKGALGAARLKVTRCLSAVRAIS